MSEENDVIEFSIAMPLDEDGFLRRECPTCEREFKWLAAQDDADKNESSSPDEVRCPYCNTPSDSDSWHTPAQLEYASSVAASEVMDPMLKEFVEGFEPNDFISVSYEPGERLSEPPAEPNDMKRIEFACHPDEPVKIAEDWGKDVHCLICGSKAT